MKSCDFYERCRLFAEEFGARMPKLVGMFKKRFCLGRFGECARCQVATAVGLQYVPDFMLPSQIDWADQIIKEQKNDRKDTGINRSSSSLIRN